MKNLELYELAVERKKEVVAKYGGKGLAQMLGISPPAVSKWQLIPPYRAFQISQFGDFEMDYIRPDINFKRNIL
jgi:DNA-binding transcriptional regulator YdaS (Cro superfamily)